MKNMLNIVSAIAISVCAACSQSKSTTIYPDWETVGIYNMFKGVVEDSIIRKLEPIRLSMLGDTVIINGQYKARFDEWKFPTEKFFDHRQTSFFKYFYEGFLRTYGAGIGDSLEFCHFGKYPDYYESDFPFSDFFQSGSLGFVYEPPYIFMAYKWYCVCFRRPNATYPVSNVERGHIEAADGFTIESNVELPYSRGIYPDTAEYKISPYSQYEMDMLPWSKEDHVKYIPLFRCDDIDVVLCSVGSVNKLLTAKGSWIISELIVEGERYHGFVIDENYNITVTMDNGDKKTYRILNNGVIVENNAVEDDEESQAFVTVKDWPSVRCERIDNNDGYSVIQKCTFPNANLKRVYGIVSKVDPNLKPELPANNLEYSSDVDGCINVSYRYESPKHLNIELFYEGGVTYIEIIEQNNGTTSKITYSAD